MSALLSHRLSFVVVLEKFAVILAGRCTLVLVCLCPSSAFALSVLTLGDAIAVVKEQNLELKEMSYRVDLSETAVDLARAAFYPNLEITINPTQRYGQLNDQTSGAYENRVLVLPQISICLMVLGTKHPIRLQDCRNWP